MNCTSPPVKLLTLKHNKRIWCIFRCFGSFRIRCSLVWCRGPYLHCAFIFSLRFLFIVVLTYIPQHLVEGYSLFGLCLTFPATSVFWKAHRQNWGIFLQSFSVVEKRTGKSASVFVFVTYSKIVVGRSLQGILFLITSAFHKTSYLNWNQHDVAKGGNQCRRKPCLTRPTMIDFDGYWNLYI